MPQRLWENLLLGSGTCLLFPLGTGDDTAVFPWDAGTCASVGLFYSSEPPLTKCPRPKHCPCVCYNQVFYPVLMFVAVLRTFFVRVRPNTLIVFTPNEVDDGVGDAEEGQRARPASFLSKVRAGWEEDHSLFAWANKGTWETAETDNEGTRREGQWFRIGFEPLFVDFTKSGAWFVAFTLVEVKSALSYMIGPFLGVIDEDTGFFLS